MNKLFSNCRVLIVEDEMLVLISIEMALNDFGCPFLAAANVSSALALLKTHRFDAAILDVNLNGEKCYPIADQLAQMGIPFAFSTGYGDHAERLDLNERPILRKPYVRATLMTILSRLLLKTPLPAVA
jgi:CheY-like chemotaxis protein